jgi:DNA repair protein RadC
MNVKEYMVLANEKRIPYLEEVRDTGLTDENSYCTPKEISKVVRNLYHAEQLLEEHIWMLAFDTKNHLIGVFEVTKGAFNSSVLNPAQILQRALLCGAVGIALVHNHPSGDVKPSKEDILLTSRVMEAVKICGIEFIDHVIVSGAGRDSIYSFTQYREL